MEAKEEEERDHIAPDREYGECLRLVTTGLLVKARPQSSSA